MGYTSVFEEIEDGLRLKIKKLESKLAVAVDALEFYADLESWQTQGYFHRTRIVNDDSNNHDGDCNIYCGGRLARQALKEIKEE